MPKIYSLLAGFIIFVLFISGCTTSPRDLLYGDWEMQLSPSLEDVGVNDLTITFTKNGSVTITLEDASAVCEYIFIDDNTIHMTCEDEIPGLAQDMDFSVNGDSMTLTIGETTLSFSKPGN
jgi:phage-related protein